MAQNKKVTKKYVEGKGEITMKKTMLTYKTLDKFEDEYVTSQYSQEEIEKIEHAAYVANMNKFNNPHWTRDDIFNDFLRVLNILKINVVLKEGKICN